jgi:hypothetical protein
MSLLPTDEIMVQRGATAYRASALEIARFVDTKIGAVTVSGGGTFAAGAAVTLTASAAGDLTNIAWSWSGPGGSSAPLGPGSDTLSWTMASGDAGTYTATATAAAADSPVSGTDSVALKPAPVCPLGLPTWSTYKEDVAWMEANADEFSTCTTYNSTWSNCVSFTSFPLINTQAGRSFTGTWRGCSNIAVFPLLNTGAGTNFNAAWDNCRGLTSFPLLNLSKATNLGLSWSGCNGLTSFPLVDTGLSTNFNASWSNCKALTTFPLLDTKNGKDFSSTWQQCSVLASIPQLNTSKGTNFSSPWAGCVLLADFPLLDLSAGTTFSGAWSGCAALTPQSTENILMALDISGKAGLTTDIGGCPRSTWTAAAIAAYDSLVTKGWAITFNNS